jgi:hypothetical protein
MKADSPERSVHGLSVVGGCVSILYGVVLVVGVALAGSVGAIASPLLWILAAGALLLGIAMVLGSRLSNLLVPVIAAGMLAVGVLALAAQRGLPDIVLSLALLSAPLIIVVSFWLSREGTSGADGGSTGHQDSSPPSNLSAG